MSRITVKPKGKRPKADYGVSVLSLCRLCLFGAPAMEYRFHPTRKWRFDFAWPESMVAVEINGGVFIQGRHTRGSGAVKDWEKLNAAQLAGWVVLQVTPTQITDGTLATLLREAL